MKPLTSFNDGLFDDEQIKISDNEESFLLILSRGDNYGSKMADVISACSNGAIDLNPGSYFPILKELSARGLVRRLDTNKDKPKSKNGKAVYYQITDIGLKALHDKENFRQKLRSTEGNDAIPT